MYKIIVFCALFAAAAAKPGALLADPFVGISSYISPVSTTITKSASSIVHPWTDVYSTPYVYSHFIKKRSPQYPFQYLTPSTYLTSSPIATSYSAPLLTSAPYLHSSLGYPAAHLIKKRSAAPLHTTYVSSYGAASTPLLGSSYAAAPWISSYAAAAPLISSPYYSSPLGYSSAHFIK